MSELNPLNDLSRVYLDHVANANQQNDDKDIKRWEEGNDALDKQMETSSKQLATLGAPQMEEEVSYVESYVDALNKTSVGIDEAERDLGDRLHRKRKLYDRTVPKAMEYARREGEAAGHARYRMGQLDREMDKVKDKMKKEK